MSSTTFCVHDIWHGSPYDVGLPNYLNLNESPKKAANDELKLLVEPALYARVLDQATGVLSNQIERLTVEPHLLLVTSEALTPQFLAREEKLREKRLLKQQQDNSKPVAAENVVESETSDRALASTPETTTTSLKRKRSLLQKSTDSTKKQKVSVTIPAPPVVAVPSSASTATPTCAVTTTPAPLVAPVAPTNQENVTKLLMQQLPQPPPQPKPAVPQTPLPNAAKPDTVLVRLSSGQVVLVPRDFLKKISPASSAVNTSVVTSTAVPSIVTTNKVVHTVSPAPLVIKPALEQPQQQRAIITTPTMKRDLPVNVSLNEALNMLRSTTEAVQTPTTAAASEAPKPNGILKQFTTDSNGKSFRYVKIRAFQGPPGPVGTNTAPSTIGTASPSASSLSEQLVKIQQMPVQLVQQNHQTMHRHQPQQQQPIVIQRTVALPAMTRFVQQPRQPGIIRRVIMPQTATSSSLSLPMTQIRPAVSLPMTQFRPATALPSFIRANGTVQSGSGQQGPMKICIIQSPRKLDGTPVSPGSATPGIVVMNQPQNLRQLNINDVLKAIAVQNASTAAAMQQNVTLPTQTLASVVQRTQNAAPIPVTVTQNVTQKIVSTETTNGLVKSQVS